MKLWVIAILAGISVAACPTAHANDGGKGGGDAAARLLQQQQQQQEEEQVPAAAAPASTAPTDAASVAARDFYASVVGGLDSAIREMRQRLAAREQAISKIDHKVAMDFADERADDKTTNDMTYTANKVLASIVNGKTLGYSSRGGPVDPAVLDALKQIEQFKADVEALKSLETARASMIEAARSFGATIN